MKRKKSKETKIIVKEKKTLRSDEEDEEASFGYWLRAVSRKTTRVIDCLQYWIHNLSY